VGSLTQTGFLNISVEKEQIPEKELRQRLSESRGKNALEKKGERKRQTTTNSSLKFISNGERGKFQRRRAYREGEVEKETEWGKG